MIRWILLNPDRSWHRVAQINADTGSVRTRCGRHLGLGGRPTSAELPHDAKSCESCLRLGERDA